MRTTSRRRSHREYWFDTHHTGALRVIDHKTGHIYGSDPREPQWCVPFTCMGGRTAPRALRVDFHRKKTHRHHQIMCPTYVARRQILRWPDGNEWHRVRVDPHLVLQHADSAATHSRRHSMKNKARAK